MRLPKFRSRKLYPKFIGPYPIVEAHKDTDNFKVDLPSELKALGIHPMFHSSLLRVHVANDDGRFPGRLASQAFNLGDEPADDWEVQEIETHTGAGKDAVFKVVWKAGDHS
ncbi:hypothetical protein AURDEDRAFT_71890, partial [Auricularia subglabra TFB-10046 SS5]